MLVVSTSLFSQVSFDLVAFELDGKNDWTEVTGSIIWGSLDMVIMDNIEDEVITINLIGDSYKIFSTDSANYLVNLWDGNVTIFSENITYTASILARFNEDGSMYLSVISQEYEVFFTYFARQQPELERIWP